jgi:hypothetical protein
MSTEELNMSDKIRTLKLLNKYFDNLLTNNFIGNIQVNFSKFGLSNINENKSIKLEGDDIVK